MAGIDWWRAPLTLEIEIMRKLIVAILSLSSVMLHAQASTPAQTQAATNGPAPQVKRISTGVIAPKLIYTVDVAADSAAFDGVISRLRAGSERHRRSGYLQRPDRVRRHG